MNGPWFRAKRYGWGWTPITWQGWLVTAGFVAITAAASIILPPGRSPAAFAGLVSLLVAALIAVCWWKGERPRWR